MFCSFSQIFTENKNCLIKKKTFLLVEFLKDEISTWMLITWIVKIDASKNWRQNVSFAAVFED